MTALRVIAVDDEPLALERIRILLDAFGDDVDLVGCADGCESGASLISQEQPDLILLDIRMRDGTAFDLLARLPTDRAPMIAFQTAFPRFACKAFEVSALHYLLKPIEPQQLGSLLDKARQHRDMRNADDRVRELQALVTSLRDDNAQAERPVSEHEIWVRHRGTDHVRIALDTIDWISAQEDYACLHANGHEHLLRISLDRLLESLDSEQFTRVHRSIIVRNDRIDRLSHKRAGTREIVLRDGTRLPVGRVYARKLAWRGKGERVQ